MPIGEIEVPGDTLADRMRNMRERLDHLRRAIVREPRGSDVLVGAVLTPPVTEEAAAGVIFCNNAGYLGMCGHGTIGVVETLRYMGLVAGPAVVLDTPVGTVRAVILPSGEVQIENVASYRYLAGVTVTVPGLGEVMGDVGYGGNWFFIVKDRHFDLSRENERCLTQLCLDIKQVLQETGIRGKDGHEIDHVELESRPQNPAANSKNFVLCPGGAYDRSPCGTGTSAKVACLHAAGQLQAGEWYVQESFTGSCFWAKVEQVDGQVIPTIRGRAYVTGETTLRFDPADPLRWGL